MADDDERDVTAEVAAERAAWTRVQRLERSRDRLELAIEAAGTTTLPALVREHRQVLAQLAALAEPAKGSTRDQLAEKRAARKSTAARKPRAARTPKA